MSQDIVGKKTRNAFREYLVGYTLREIEMEFEAAGIECSRDHDPSTDGARRSFVEQYYHSLDFTDWADARKLLSVYESILDEVPDERGRDRELLLKCLNRDGFEYTGTRILPSGGLASLAHVKGIAAGFDSDYMARQIAIMEGAIAVNPALAIGTAKELVETCCKTILLARGRPAEGAASIIDLTKATVKELKLLPDDIPDGAKGAKTIKRLLSNLAMVTQGLAELRNPYGSGHGKDGTFKGLEPRHAKLAVGAASTLASFLFETDMSRPADDPSAAEGGEPTE